MTIKKLSAYIIINALIIIGPFISFGQTITNDSFLSLTMSPNNPEPFSEISLDLKSYVYDLNRSKITWFINGIEEESNIGQTKFTTKLGANGERKSVRVIVDVPEKGIKTTGLGVTPSTVDLIYESSSYTPPFYKGKALYTNQSSVLITAIPDLRRSDGTKIPDKNIIYLWKKDGQSQKSVSGYGKNTFLFNNPFPFRDFNIEVEASSLEGDIRATKRIKIDNNPVKIIFYENDPVYGLINSRAITNNFSLFTNELSVSAIPFFFNISEANSPDLDYSWSVNGSKTENQEIKNTFTTRIERSGSGTANINLRIENLKNNFQNTDGSYTLKYQIN